MSVKKHLGWTLERLDPKENHLSNVKMMVSCGFKILDSHLSGL